jgi:small subunit ribosomal protein S8
MDQITDMLNRIRNAQAVGHAKAEIPFSNLKYEIAKILEKKSLVSKTEKKGRKAQKLIEITLKYSDKIPAISGLKRISKPGQRIYRGFKQLKPVKSGYGIAVVSTPKGLMTDKEARKQKTGGEVICQIW